MYLGIITLHSSFSNAEKADRLMSILSKKFKGFDWHKNSGYGTTKHIREIYKVGPTIHHRKTFEPIKSLIHTK